MVVLFCRVVPLCFVSHSPHPPKLMSARVFPNRQCSFRQPSVALIVSGYYSNTNKALAPVHPERHARSGQKQDGKQVLPSEPVLPNMQALKLICERMRGLLKLAVRLPHSVAVARQQRRRQFAWSVREAERLDRIRNPSRYQGK